MKNKRILCPVDFSACSNVAFRHAVDLAVAQDATLLLVHVTLPPPEFVSGFAGYGPMPPYHPEPDSRLEELKDSRVEIKYTHLVGLEGETIVKFAEQKDCSLIVMGTHGYGAVHRLLFGSVADFVLRHAKCPVVVIKDRVGEVATKEAKSDASLTG
ncbi:MAG: universal stress protein [Planctomycetota bacterium]